LLVQISYERNQKGSFYIFSYTRNYEQSDRLDCNCISHQLSNDKTSIH
jgi:intergrase/recombinase